jgi:hypothetical protein
MGGASCASVMAVSRSPFVRGVQVGALSVTISVVLLLGVWVNLTAGEPPRVTKHDVRGEVVTKDDQHVCVTDGERRPDDPPGWPAQVCGFVTDGIGGDVSVGDHVRAAAIDVYLHRGSIPMWTLWQAIAQRDDPDAYLGPPLRD